jgi:hypothetical protein
MSNIGVQDIKTALVSAITGSHTDIDGVVDYVYWSDSLEDIYSQFVDDNGNLQKWMIGWSSSPATVRKGGMLEKRFVMNIFGIFGIREDNTSSGIFETYIEAIQDYMDNRNSILAGTKHLPSIMLGIQNSTYRNAYPIHGCQIQITFIANNESLVETL